MRASRLVRTLMRTPPAHERGGVRGRRGAPCPRSGPVEGVWGNREVSPACAQASTTGFPPRPRAEGKRCSCALPDLPADLLVAVADALALVRLGRAHLADLGGGLSNRLLVDALHDH